MRVVCQTVEEFLEDLKHESNDALFQKTIRVSRIERIINEAKKEIIFQASAVVGVEGGGEYLLEVGENCGFDYSDQAGEKSGTVRSNFLKRSIKAVCDKRGWVVRPGTIDM